MKIILFRDRRKRNKMILITAVAVSVLLILRIFFLSFSNEIGQAKAKIKATIISSFYENIMESKSAVIGYRSIKAKENYPFPINMVSNYYNIHRYVSSKSSIKDRVNITLADNSIKKNKDNLISIKNLNIDNGFLTREYILTNGEIFNRDDYNEHIETGSINGNINELPVKIMDGALDYNEFSTSYGGEGASVETMRTSNGTPFTLEQLNDVSFLIQNFYIIDPATRISEDLFNARDLLERDMTIKTTNDKPQILIYHTHSQEAFIDSREGVTEDSVVGVGDILAKILKEKYGYNVIHDRSVYDLVDGNLDRNRAYNFARESISKILDENPSIEVIIDLHRDGAEKRSTYINGQETAQIMLLNGLSKNQGGSITRLYNPNLQDNLAFSLQLHLKSLEMYPGLFYKNYLQAYRYNLDLRPKSLLVELGTHKNTLKSAKNAMEPFAEILDAVLKGK